ncbi:MAG: phospholipase C, phosphocholine-specific [Aquabacterium sp.]|uniref:phosphocholine-specific phospholipase C n=1 Tax=Aquabacterium sp. TaxID=1872578 RepID=UPI0025C643D3|nr:phospholipase C, phosphocholine-specific [Aquabacterium sp.]MBI3380658.1 phospholipase C, phosphocholine-specific [Aquabacterium sp.]
MTPIDRRQFLTTTAQAAATVSAASAMPAAIARALGIPAHHQTGTIKDVQHVVILTQENRSFDHYFGKLRGVRGFGDRLTIPLPEGQRVWAQSNGTRTVLPYHLDSSQGNAQRVNGTPHSWGNAQAAWDNGRMSQWPKYKHDHAMGYYTEAEVGFQYALANAFTVCDAYHCALQGGTNPNRLFMWTGTNGPTGAGVAAVVNEWDDFGPANEGYTWTTYPERLQAAGVSWKVYQNLPDNFTDNSLVGFKQYREAAYKALATIPNASPLMPYDPSMEAISPLLKGITNTMPDGGFLETFQQEVLNGQLPQVSWIVAPEAYSEHPGPSSPVQGAWYVQEVLNALTANPEVWSKTVLIVNFDENDGFFDHMPPPAAPSIDAHGQPAGQSTTDVAAEYFTHPKPPGTTGQPAPDGRAYGMGPRVPAFVVSPWSRGGWVNSQVFDHTSIIRFLEARFGVMEPNISAWRRAVAGDLTSTLNFVNPNDETLPTLPTLTREEADALRAQQEVLAQVAVPAESTQSLPGQARGIRPSRALPYDLRVDSDIDPRTQRAQLRFVNTGRAGAVFHVYDQLHLDRLPRRYTVEAGKQLQGSWDTSADAGRYDLWVLGPNGFHRHFKGNGNAATDLDVRTLASRHMLRLTLHNDSNEARTFKISFNAYHRQVPHTVRVPAGRELEWDTNLMGTGGWYDLSITVKEDPAFSRRLAGRLETGRHSVSDPALGA